MYVRGWNTIISAYDGICYNYNTLETYSYRINVAKLTCLTVPYNISMCNCMYGHKPYELFYPIGDDCTSNISTIAKKLGLLGLFSISIGLILFVNCNVCFPNKERTSNGMNKDYP